MSAITRVLCGPSACIYGGWEDGALGEAGEVGVPKTQLLGIGLKKKVQPVSADMRFRIQESGIRGCRSWSLFYCGVAKQT